ncbi:MAG: DEAD/DEAH box helicase [Bacteroidota bacterium]
MSFSKLGLNDRLVQGILATGYTAPTMIQSRAIPAALAGKDVIGCAQTGTGKTAAFVLPILNRLSADVHVKHRGVRALILTPTRELAQQIEDSINSYGRFMSLQSLAVFGGVNIQNQIKRLRRGIDIVVATPGRLLDHLERQSIDLSNVDVLVLDEADRMFDMGFIQDVRKIIAKVPAHRQTMLFSATMSKEVRTLTASIQKHPEFIEVGEQRKPVDTVTQHFYSVHQELKVDLLLHILESAQMESVLVFSRTKHGADKISHRLERKGIKSVAIHSNRTQAQRQRALAGFKHGDFKVLVATDIAARGIDVEGITHVVNFDTPTFAEDYIHRIGRTGRATSKGDALTFVARNEQEYLRKIEYFVGKKFELKKYPGFDDTKRPAAVSQSTETVRTVHHTHHVDSRRQFDKPQGTWEERQRRRERGDHPAANKSTFQKPFRKRRPDNRGYHRPA